VENVDLRQRTADKRVKLTVTLYGKGMEAPIQSTDPEAQDLVRELNRLVDVSFETDHTMHVHDLPQWALILAFFVIGRFASWASL